jgi:RND family efflux transporter MFP subunit
VEAEVGPISIKRRLITSIVVIGVAIFLGVHGFKKLAAMRAKSARSNAGVLPPLVRAESARRADYTESLRGFGRAEPLQRATVVAEVAGVVTDVAPILEAGNAIIANAASDGSGTTGSGGADAAGLPVLVRLDDRDLVDRLERTREDVKAAEAEIVRLSTVKGSLRERLAVADEELETAERELERILPLVPKTLTRSALDTQRLQVTLRQQAKLTLGAQIKENVEAVKVAEARLASLRRVVNLAEREFTRAVIRAPFAGRIEARLVDVGERVRVGDPLFTIVNLSRIQVPVALAAGQYAEVKRGAKARVHLPEQTDVLWEGVVDRVAPQINAMERTFYAYLVVTGADSETPVPPGTHVVADIEGRTHADVVPVPRRAFLGRRVFVAHPDKEAAEGIYVVSERAPTVERFLSGVALVRNGIEDGELVLVTNLESVAEGSRVRLVIDGAK